MPSRPMRQSSRQYRRILFYILGSATLLRPFPKKIFGICISPDIEARFKSTTRNRGGLDAEHQEQARHTNLSQPSYTSCLRSPRHIDKVFQAETDFVGTLTRTGINVGRTLRSLLTRKAIQLLQQYPSQRSGHQLQRLRWWYRRAWVWSCRFVTPTGNVRLFLLFSVDCHN